ncbi:hypothetical protein CPter291_1357 [Collimonas pratensis]|uniref:Uncharacterized protein n=1 Tax=Collimonas pratensis TaxID=279113 RepID=A0ABN4M770_9BURK|nr:hypothetical protein CPter291_1357 [Collimonas pratensis]
MPAKAWFSLRHTDGVQKGTKVLYTVDQGCDILTHLFNLYKK